MQLRLRDYQEPLTSFEHNIHNLGLHHPGRYMGFDGIQLTGANTFNLVHTGAYGYKDPAGNTVGPIGVLVTNQGTKVIETDFIPGFAVESNVGNNSVRWDAIVFNHIYAGVNGGNPGTYSLLKGPLGSANKPVLTSPFYQTIIGWVRHSPNQASITADNWVKAKSPDSGDGLDARLLEENGFKKLNMFNQSATIPTEAFDVNTGKWHFKNDGNVFKIEYGDGNSTHIPLRFIKIEDAEIQNGTTIDIMINGNITVEEAYDTIPEDQANGYRRIIIPQKMKMGTQNNGYAMYIMGHSYKEILTFKLIDGTYFITNTCKVYERAIQVEESNLGKIIFGDEVLIGDPGGQPGSDSLKQILFPTPLPDNKYWVLGTLRSISQGTTGWNNDNDVFFMIREKSYNGFKVAFREVSNAPQSLMFDYVIIQF